MMVSDFNLYNQIDVHESMLILITEKLVMQDKTQFILAEF